MSRTRPKVSLTRLGAVPGPHVKFNILGIADQVCTLADQVCTLADQVCTLAEHATPYQQRTCLRCSTGAVDSVHHLMID